MNKLAICCECGNPLISTMMWAGAEFYCLNCGENYGFLSPNSVNETPARLKKYERIKSIWDLIANNLLPNRKYERVDCKLCEIDSNHRNHLTDEEKKNHAMAIKVLENVKGLFDE